MILCPLSLIRARTLPGESLQINKSPTDNVPFCISTVPTGPSPLSIRDSMTVPRAGQSKLDCKFNISDSRRIPSIKSSMPVPCFAETSTAWIFPPQSSTRTSFSESSRFTLSTSAPGLSILLMATTMGTWAARAWLIASIV